MKHKPFVIVVSAPSGTGKTTVLNYLKTLDNNLFYSVSATSRAKRPGEVEKLELRLALAESELRWAYEYEYWVINDDVEKAANRILSIINAERMRQKRVIYKDLKK